MKIDLAAEMRSAGLASRLVHFKYLVTLGVPLKPLARMRLSDWGWGVVHALDGEDGLYRPGDGPLHVVLPVYDDGVIIDLVAFRSSDPANWKLRTGIGLALGLERGWERHHWADDVELSITPLDWLRNCGEGICIVDWDAPEIYRLDTLPRITCPDARAASRLKLALTRPQHLPHISIKETRLAA